MTFYLGVDAGGSTCRARLVDAAGVVQGKGKGGPANARLGIDTVAAALRATIDQAVAAAGLSAAQIATIRAGIGIAGLSLPGVGGALNALPFPFRTRFTGDATIANLGAHGGADGAILVLGTGSIAQVRVDGEEFAIGGYGFPISDEGSGAALGLSAMRHALRALDGRTRPTPLSTAVTERFDHRIPRAIGWMNDATAADYASFAPLVMDHAEGDDPIARSIVEHAARHVERFVETIFARGAPRCALMGGLAPRMRPWLRARTVALLCEPQGDALDGALRFAGLCPVG